MKQPPSIVTLPGREYIDKFQASGAKTVFASVEMNGLRYTLMLFGDETSDTINILNTVAAIDDGTTLEGIKVLK